MIWVNGICTDHIPVSDRGFQYGDGVWETIAIRDGHIEFWNAHLHRLTYGLKQLAIDFDTGILNEDWQQIQSSIDLTNNYVLKMIVTRGSGGRGYAPPNNNDANRVLSLHPMPNYPEGIYQSGVDVMLCSTRLSHNPQLAGFKHLNRLEQVLARQEVVDPYFEGIVRDQDGYAIEGTMSNVFILNQQQLLTPDLSGCGIKGIWRDAILNMSQTTQWTIKKTTKLSILQLEQADAMFLTNSIIGMLPVRSFNGKSYPSLMSESYLASLREQLVC